MLREQTENSISRNALHEQQSAIGLLPTFTPEDLETLEPLLDTGVLLRRRVKVNVEKTDVHQQWG